MNGLLSENILLTPIKAHSASGTATITSDAVDMAASPGFQNVLLFCRFGTAASNTTIKAQQSDDDGSADDYTDILGSSVASGSSDELCWLDVKPTKRYVKLLALPAGTSTVETMYAARYHARTLPIDNTISGTSQGETSVDAGEGTA